MLLRGRICILLLLLGGKSAGKRETLQPEGESRLVFIAGSDRFANGSWSL